MIAHVTAAGRAHDAIMDAQSMQSGMRAACHCQLAVAYLPLACLQMAQPQQRLSCKSRCRCPPVHLLLIRVVVIARCYVHIDEASGASRHLPRPATGRQLQRLGEAMCGSMAR
jgi:hypothetical protein